ncbi:MAG: alpha/beta hydrolase [Novosphingobium sp.]
MSTQPTSIAEPLILTVPGLLNSGPDHWQSLWEQQRPDTRRVELGMWDRPHRNTWVNQLNLAIYRAGRPVVLAAHSLGCLAVAWWAKYERPASFAEGGPVIGALLVAPPEVDFFPLDERLTQFSPTPAEPLPFRSILVASRNDPYIGIHAARKLARTWGSSFADAGEAGHINAESGLGRWAFGEFLLGQLLAPAPLADAAGHRGGTRGVATSGEGLRFAHGRRTSPAG